MVEVCGGSDYELANPRTPMYCAQPNPTLTLQSGKVLSNAPEDISEYTVGESINSVKQLISIPKVTALQVGAAAKYTVTIPPWYYQPCPSILIPAPTANLTESFGFGGNIAHCYTFAKGGTDFHAYLNQSNTSGKAWLSVAQISNSQTTTTVQSPAQMPFSNNPRIINSSGSALHARLPAYQQQLRYSTTSLNNVCSPGQAWGFKGNAMPALSWNATNPTALYNLTFCSNFVTQAVTSRSAADDASLAIYIGPPPLLLLSTNTAATVYDVDSDNSIF